MMNQDAQELTRLRAAFTAPAGPAPAPEDCPAPDSIWSAVRGELPPQEMRQVVEHTASCAACAEDWRLAAEVNRQEAEQATVQTPGKVITGRFGQWRAWGTAVAVAAALLIAVGLFRSGQMGPQEPTYRDVQHTGISSLLKEGETLPRQDAVLRWSPVPGAVSYDVQVSTEDLQTIASAQGQTGTAFRIPVNNLANLRSGTRLLWQVEAVRADGTREPSATFITALK
jgi:hypothetical protein